MTKKNKKPNYNDKRTFLYLGVLKKILFDYFNSDPRFKSNSACASHLIKLGMKHDKKGRQKAIKSLRE